MSVHARDLDALRELLLAEVRRLDDLVGLIETERRLTQQRLEEGISERFKSVNEFRSSLEDLGKGMATRRELETGLAAVRTERNALVGTNDARLAVVTEQVGELRSRLDTGPGELHKLQSLSDQAIGAKTGSAAVVAYIFASVTVVVSLAAVAVTLMTH